MATFTALTKSKLRDATHSSSDLIDEASDTFNTLYKQSGKWIKKNSGKTLAGVALVAAVGVIGYFAVKTISENMPDIDI